MQVLLVSMMYGYCGPLKNGDSINLYTSQSRQRGLNGESTYAIQVQSLVDFVRDQCHEILMQQDFHYPNIPGYFHILSHSVAVINHE